MARKDTDKVALDLIRKGPAKEAKRPLTTSTEDTDRLTAESQHAWKKAPHAGGMAPK